MFITEQELSNNYHRVLACNGILFNNKNYTIEKLKKIERLKLHDLVKINLCYIPFRYLFANSELMSFQIHLNNE